ncbi:MAG: hypothetical protein ACXVBE_16270 [Bdellovibrionota bacterium]
MRSNNKYLPIAIVAVLAGIFLALYLPALSFPYEFDDLSNVIFNRAIRYLNHPRIFIESEYSRNRPLTSISFAVSYRLAGLSLGALRIPSLIFHALNALLVGLFFFRFYGKRKGGLFGALLAGGIFLLHPLAVDSVIYYSGRASLMVLFFLLTALWCYGRPRPGIFSWLIFLFSAAAAVLTKESALGLLPLLLLYHLYLRRRWIELAPYCLPLIMAGVAGLVLKWNYLNSASQGLFQIGGEVDIYSLSEYLPISLAQWPQMIRLFFRPDLQAIDHQIVVPASWRDPQLLGGVFLWALVPVLLYAYWRKRDAIFFFALWVFGSLLITNSIFPILDPFAERHLYLALPALAWMVAWLFLRALEFFPRQAWIIPFCLLVGVAWAGTEPRIEVWRSPVSLWLNAYEKYPKKFRVVYNSWSSLAQTPDGHGQALGILRKYLAGQRLGTLTYEEQETAVGAAAMAVKSLSAGDDKWARAKELLGEKEDIWSALILLSAMMENKPDPKWLHAWQEAAERFQDSRLAAKAREPDLAVNTFYLLRAKYFVQAGDLRAAIRDYERVFNQFPGKYFPYWTKREELGDLYMKVGKEGLALQQYQLATMQHLSYKRFPPSLYRKLIDIFLSRKDFERASDAIGQLVRVDSDNPEIRQQYAELLRLKGDKNALRQTKEAEFYAEHAIKALDLREAVRP